MIKTIVQQIKLFSGERKEFYLFLKKLFGFPPADMQLYETAVTHRSASRQDSQNNWVNNERLEYLGDAILGAVIAEFLYNRFPKQDEGFLTQMRSKLVNRSFLSSLTFQTGLNHYIKSNTNNTQENSHIYGDALEALIGALYLDKGYVATSRFITKKLLQKFVDLRTVEFTNRNFKSQLIEWSQKNKKEINIETTEHHQVENKPSFISVITIGGEVFGQGKGNSKKESQQHASQQVIKTLRQRYPETF
ncbi:MAG: ribonuclease III [Mangrovibacterium sp.]